MVHACRAEVTAWRFSGRKNKFEWSQTFCINRTVFSLNFKIYRQSRNRSRKIKSLRGYLMQCFSKRHFSFEWAWFLSYFSGNNRLIMGINGKSSSWHDFSEDSYCTPGHRCWKLTAVCWTVAMELGVFMDANVFVCSCTWLQSITSPVMADRHLQELSFIVSHVERAAAKQYKQLPAWLERNINCMEISSSSIKVDVCFHRDNDGFTLDRWRNLFS